MIKATRLGVWFCFTIYLISGLLGFLMFKYELYNVVLDNLRGEIPLYYHKDKFITTILIVVNLSFLISSTMSIPLLFFSLKKNLLNTIIFIKKNCFRRHRTLQVNEHEILEIEANKITESSRIAQPTINRKQKIIITIVLYITVLIVTLLVKMMRDVNNI